MDFNLLNPVDLIARARLMLLLSGGRDAANELAEELGFPVEEGTVKNTLAPSLLCENILYSAVKDCIKRTDCKNVLELSCGYSPLGWELAKDGYNYVGADNLGIAETMAFAANNKNMKGCRYISIDYSNEASLFAAADMLDGPIIIISQGLTSAMSMNEKLLALETIGKVLAYHGGVWFLPDLDARRLTQGLRKILSGKESAVQNNKLDLDSLGWQDSRESIRALKSLKFDVSGIPVVFSCKNQTLENIAGFENIEAIQKLASTLSMGRVEAGPMPDPDNDLEVFADLKGTRLIINLVGVMNSDTAPLLLDEFEKMQADGGIVDISVDCLRLRYISSAGLRVFLIMKKAIGDGVLRIKNPNAMVREVLDNTGFDNLVEVI